MEPAIPAARAALRRPVPSVVRLARAAAPSASGVLEQESNVRLKLVGVEQRERIQLTVEMLNELATVDPKPAMGEDAERAAIVRAEDRAFHMMLHEHHVERVSCAKRSAARIASAIDEQETIWRRGADAIDCEQLTSVQTVIRWHVLYCPRDGAIPVRMHKKSMSPTSERRHPSPGTKTTPRPPSTSTVLDVRNGRHSWQQHKSREQLVRQVALDVRYGLIAESRARLAVEGAEAEDRLAMERGAVAAVFQARRGEAARSIRDALIAEAKAANRAARRDAAAVRLQQFARRLAANATFRSRQRTTREILRHDDVAWAAATVQAFVASAISTATVRRCPRPASEAEFVPAHPTRVDDDSDLEYSALRRLRAIAAEDGDLALFPALQVLLGCSDAGVKPSARDDQQRRSHRFEHIASVQTDLRFPWMHALRDAATRVPLPLADPAALLPLPKLAACTPVHQDTDVPTKQWVRYTPILPSRFAALDAIARCYQPPNRKTVGNPLLAVFQAAHRTDPRNIPYMERMMHLSGVPYRVPTPTIAEPVEQLPGLMALFNASRDDGDTHLSLQYLRHSAWCVEHEVATTEGDDVDAVVQAARDWEAGVETRWWPYSGWDELYEEERVSVMRKEFVDRNDLERHESNSFAEIEELCKALSALL